MVIFHGKMWFCCLLWRANGHNADEEVNTPAVRPWKKNPKSWPNTGPVGPVLLDKKTYSGVLLTIVVHMSSPMFMQLDDGNILTGKPDQFDGKNPWFPVKMFPTKPIQWQCSWPSWCRFFKTLRDDMAMTRSEPHLRIQTWYRWPLRRTWQLSWRTSQLIVRKEYDYDYNAGLDTEYWVDHVDLSYVGNCQRKESLFAPVAQNALACSGPVFFSAKPTLSHKSSKNMTSELAWTCTEWPIQLYSTNQWKSIYAMWMCLKMSCTPKPNGFADHYPYEKWLFHWEY